MLIKVLALIATQCGPGAGPCVITAVDTGMFVVSPTKCAYVLFARTEGQWHYRVEQCEQI